MDRFEAPDRDERRERAEREREDRDEADFERGKNAPTWAERHAETQAILDRDAARERRRP